MIKKKGLGRGLEALLGANTPAVPSSLSDAPTTLPLSDLKPGRYQPRTRMDPGALEELAQSIRSEGLMQPILVRPIATGHYEIIAGERRARAAKLAGMTEVPVLVRDVPDERAAVMALIENIQREDLNPLEEAQGVERLLREFNLTHEQAARAIGKSRSATSNLLRLLGLVKPVQALLMTRTIDMGHARALLALDGASQIALANEVVARQLSVRETEKLVARLDAQTAAPKRAQARTKSRDLARLEEELSDVLAAPVSIRMKARDRGQLTVDFSGLEQLEGLVARFKR